MSSEQIEQLKKEIRIRINEEEKGVSTYFNTLLIQANVTLQKNASPNLNSLDFAVLMFIFIDYLYYILN
jgi:hypothetical protein